MKRPSGGILFAALAAILTTTILAQTPPPAPKEGPRIVDTKLNREERIEERREWFFSSRRAGAATPEEMARLRAAGVRATRVAIDAQRMRRSAGMDFQENFWVPMGPSPSAFGGWTFGNVAGRVSTLALDPVAGTLYVGTASGGLWRSDNDGLSWINVFETAGTMTIGTVAIDPNDPDVIWAGTGENNQGCETYFGIGLLRSPDGGATWEARNGTGGQTLDDLSSFANIAVDPRNSSHLVTGGRIRGCTGGSSTSGGIFTSDDAGLTWTESLPGVAVYEIAQDPTVQDTFWAATSAGVYKSIDNAETWVRQTASGLPNGSTGRTELAVSPSSSNTVYALFQSPSELWRTTDGGATWTRQATGGDACDGQCSYNMVLRVHTTNPDIVVRGTIRVWRSIDGGVNWTDLSNGWGSSQKVHQDMHVVVMDPNDPDTFYAGGDGGLWKTTNLGSSFLNRNGDLNITQFYAVGVDAQNPDVICGGAQDNSSLARTTSNVWNLQTVTGDGFVCHFDPINPNYAYITSYPSGGYPSIYRSTGGVLGGFSRVSGGGSGIISGDRINWVTPYLLDPIHPATLYVGTHRVYRSDDHGSSWTHVGPADLTGNSGSLKALEIHRSDTDVLYSGSGSGKIWRTANGGSAWTDISSGLPSRGVNDVAADPDDVDRALAVVGGFNTGHLWEWNAGGSWVQTGAGLPNVPANTVLMLSGTDVLVGTDTGVFRSSDGGATFEPYMNGLPQGLVVTDLKYNAIQSIVTAGTYGRGAWQVPVQSYGSIVIFDSVDLPLTEIDGDGDANVEPGETWSARPTLRNIGSETAIQAQARLVSSTPGITVLDTTPRVFGDIAPGGAGPASTPYEFTVDPALGCGSVATFDLVDVTSSDDPEGHPDAIAAFEVPVDNGIPAPVPVVLVDENFDSGNAPDWSHQAVDAGLINCTRNEIDQWGYDTKDAGRGLSYHCGNGAGGKYGILNYAWLHLGGTDAGGGPGLVIPAEAQVATLTLTHWYDTVPQGDGGQVVIDAVADGQDTYAPLTPAGGYSGNIAGAGCNGLEGTQAFYGSSGGWVTSTFDLTAHRGKTVWLAFVFGSDDRKRDDSEGWWIDRIRIETQQPGDPTCDVIRWPGTVPATIRVDKVGGSDLQATWASSCNDGEVPGQTYSLHAGTLASLRSGSYDHHSVGGGCDRTSPALFTPGAGDEYYLVAPVADGREGGHGLASSGALRPQVDGTCGLPREETCP